jgi:hypothetical protein
MSLEANKDIARRANAMWAGGNTERAEDIFAPGYVNHQESDVAGGCRRAPWSSGRRSLPDIKRPSPIAGPGC